MKKEKFVFKDRRQPVWAIVKVVMSIILGHKPKVINYNTEILDKSLLLSTHDNKFGPMYLSIYFPKKHAIWGAFQMTEGYKSRWHYLRDVLYMQKNHRGKFFSSIKATIEAIFSRLSYKGLMVIPSFPDVRLTITYRYSTTTIDNNLPVMVFPEDSDDGYFELLKAVHPGFIGMSKYYEKVKQEELPIYPVYTNIKKRLIIIGKKTTLKEIIAEVGPNNDDICKYMCNLINNLYLDYQKINSWNLFHFIYN